jgi:uncharacterized protein (TIGR02466 family)
MNLELYFPSPIWWEQTNIDTDKLLDLCYRLKKQNPEGRKLSNQGGWQSMDFRADTYPEMKPLEDRIIEQAQQCVRDFGYKENSCFVVIENFWFNVNTKNHTNSTHIHDNSFVSGVFYVKALGRGQGSINFYREHSQDYTIVSQAIIERYTPLSASAISFQPEEKKLIMFPGWMPHGVERNELEEERISISFNVKLIRTDDERYWPANFKRN